MPFLLAKGGWVVSFRAPCQESLEKQRHGKPLPNASRWQVRGRSFVANKEHATCCKARTASASAGWVKHALFPMLTLETSKRIFPSTETEAGNGKRPRPRIGRPLHSL